jgi:hypothetical protein
LTIPVWFFSLEPNKKSRFPDWAFGHPGLTPRLQT